MTSSTDLNLPLFERAKAVIPGGVNSPVRAFKAVGGTPRFVKRAQGAYFWDANDQRFIDYIGSWGPMILGHGHPAVLEAVQKAAVEGFSFGAPTEREVELAEEILSLVPSMEMVRLVSSGTEAGMSAIRLARGATGRSKFIKFEGCYHGHADALLVKAGSGLATFGNATSAGVPAEVVQHTLVLEYNNVAQLEEAFALHGKELACVMIEPIAGNMNLVRASVPFMRRCRELCTEYGALLVLDEVMTGFRVALGSAQSVYAKSIPGFKPDITVLGKVIGGGMPLAAFGGPRAIMEHLAPLGAVYQARCRATRWPPRVGWPRCVRFASPDFSTPCLPPPVPWSMAWPLLPLPKVCPSARTAKAACSASSCCPRCRKTMPRCSRPTAHASTPCSTACSTGACTLHQHCTRPVS